MGANADKGGGGSEVEGMLRDIEREIRLTRHLIGRDHFSPRVMEAMRRVPRHAFVGGPMRALAYHDGPLPIGHGQTISQPYIVALMTDLLEPRASDQVLEVGTGSGYQAAVLAELVATVYTVEILEALASAAAQRLTDLGYRNVVARVGDGHQGWPEHGPYDGILVTAAAPHIPPALVEQLKPGARLVVPVGSPFQSQDLVLVEKRADGSVRERSVLPVAFVPLTGGH
jgi:protein-L-isoaspartate(D-aspartate) O-methyltransferase